MPAPADQTADADAAGRAYRLLTFGRLALLDATGAEEPSLTTRRRKLALLAYLMLRRRPVPRSVLIEVFWGERDEERARKSLSDALSHLRRVLGPGLVAAYATEIAVVPDAAPSVDALELERAALARDHERVLSLYEGPFLHGVFIEGSTAFEDWSARERRRFEDMFVAACAAACQSFARDRAWNACEEVAERWLDARPASADAAVYLLNAVKADDSHESRLRALDAYERIRQRLAREYELEPEPAVRALAAEIANAVKDTSRASEPPRAVSRVGANGKAPAVTAELAPVDSLSPAAESVPAPRAPEPAGPSLSATWRRRRNLVWAATAATLILVAAVAALLPTARTDASPAALSESPLARRPTVAIAPFVTEVDSASMWLSEALPGLIAAKLAHFDQIEIVPAEQMRGASRNPVERARPFGAAIIASGALTRRDSVLTLDLTLHSADRRLLARHALEGTNVLALADLAAVRVLNAADVVAEGASLGELETSSVAAYRHYYLAMQATIRSEMPEAARQLDAAIALDSGFVTALLERYRMAVDRVEPEVGARLRPALRRARERMSGGDRLRFDAEIALYAGDATRSEFLAGTLVERYPHSVRALAAYITVFMAHGRDAEVEQAFKRLLALAADTSTAEQRTLWCGHLSARGEFRRMTGNIPGAVSDARRVTERCPETGSAWTRYSWTVLAAGQIGEARRAAERARALVGTEERFLLGHIMLRERRWESVDSAAEAWLERGPADARIDALDLQSAALRERGRYRDAIALDDRTRKGWEFLLPQIHTDNLGRAGEFARLRRYRPVFAPVAKPVLSMLGDTLLMRGEGARGWSWHRALYGDAIMRSGDTAAVRALADSLAVVGSRSYYARDWRVHHHLRGLLAAHAGRHEEAIREFQQALWGTAGWTRTNVELARSLLALGRAHEAVAILRAAYAANLDAMGRYATITEIDYYMTLAFRAAGQRDSAAVYEGYVRRSWANADTVVAPLLRALGSTAAATPDAAEASTARR